MSAPPSSYGERPPLQGFRRSFSTPHRRLSHHERAGLEKSDADAEVLFSHPSARIVHFAPLTDSTIKAPTDFDTDYPVDTIETLPWASITETTLASGLLVIEKIRGSTNFLKSGDVQKPILRNSQCWCVDNVSKFVLRVRQFVYYRVELPTATAEDISKVEEFKTVLKRILKYEVTPCPFKRGFHVDLPESALTPRRKGTWKRKEGSLSSPLNEESRIPRLKSSRTWNRRAVSDGRLLNKASVESHTDSDDANIQHQDKSSLQTPASTTLRSNTPSSLASSEQDADSEEHGHESDETRSETEEHLGDSLQVEEEVNTESDSQDQDILPPKRPNGEAIAESSTEHESGHLIIDKSEDQPIQIDGTSDALPPDTGDVNEPDQDDLESSRSLAEEALIETESSTEDEPTATPSIVNDVAEESPLEDHEAEMEHATLAAASPVDSIPQESSVGDHSQTGLENLSVEEADILNEPREVSSDAANAGHLSCESPIEDEQSLESKTDPTLEDLPDDTLSKVSSIDSFHTLASSDEPVENMNFFDNDQTPMVEHYNPIAIASQQHKRELSELTVTASSPRSADEEADLTWVDVTPSSPAIQEGLRHRLSRRSLSPLPPSATLFAPHQHQSQGNHLTSALLQKACNLALVKPIEVVVLLVHILARIAGGATVNDLMSGDLFKMPEHERDHRRNSSLPDQIHLPRDDGTDEDDFGIPIRGRARSSEAGRRNDETDSLLDLD